MEKENQNPEQQGKNGEKHGIKENIHTVNEIEAEVINSAQTTVNETFSAVDSVARKGLDVTKNIADESISDVSEVGGNLVNTAKIAASGAAEIGKNAMETARNVIGSATRNALDVESDLFRFVRKTVDNVLDITKEVGTNAEKVVQNVASGGLDAIGVIGVKAVDTARDLLVEIVDGVKKVGNAASPKKQSEK
jgi:phage-related protein